ncbi:hypothetical protein GCM10010250_06430 [Streptomyces althioticus]|nr:hypothetical protein GCM10010250_06430 [Streptomyces althioticus]
MRTAGFRCVYLVRLSVRPYRARRRCRPGYPRSLAWVCRQSRWTLSHSGAGGGQAGGPAGVGEVVVGTAEGCRSAWVRQEREPFEGRDGTFYEPPNINTA